MSVFSVLPDNSKSTIYAVALTARVATKKFTVNCDAFEIERLR